MPTGRMGAIVVLAAIVVGSAAGAGQRSNTAAIRARLASPALLGPSDIADILQAAREAVAYRTLRLSLSPTGTPGPEVMMDSDGRPKFVHAKSGFTTVLSGQTQPTTGGLETFTHYTRQAARSCDGSQLTGELVVEYQDTGRGWSVRSRTVDIIEPLGPIFATLTGEVALNDAGHGTVDGRPARDLRAPWKPPDIQIEERLSGGGISERRTMPGGPIPADAAQHLWIDERTLLPLRWAITMTPPPGAAPAAPLDYGMFFVLDPSIELRPPDGVQAPACVP